MTTQPLTSQEYQFANLDEAIEFYYQQGWTDGLPVVPPTPDKVMAALAKAGLEPNDVLGVVPVRETVVTAEKVAINAIMAGCLPEYMPVVAAATRAVCEDPFDLNACASSTGGTAILLVINGPARHKLVFNSGANLFGPGYRANATVGRAMRLVLTNVCGAIPGLLDRSSLGHPGKYSYCIAEDEESSPWEPLHVERGFPGQASTVTVFPAYSPWQAGNLYGNTPEDVLATTVDIMRTAERPRNGPTEIVVVISPQIMDPIKEAGWTKKRVRQFLFESTHRTAEEWAHAGRIEPNIEKGKEKDLIPLSSSREDIIVIPAGGEGGVWSAIIPLWSNGLKSRSVTKEIDISHI